MRTKLRIQLRLRLTAKYFVLAGALPFASLVHGGPADDIRGLIDQGKSLQAYELGKQNRGELGKPDFDFQYGLAAIDAGAAGEGVLALERYLLNNPTSIRAKLELGRGYFVLGDNIRAREMFSEISTLSPPPEVRAKVDRFLAAITEKEAAFKTAVSGYLETTIGRDTNVNGGIAQDSITLPIFGVVTLTADGRKRGGAFYGLAGGVQVNAPLSPTFSIFAGLNADQRSHFTLTQFDQSNVSGVLGMTFKHAGNRLRFSLSGNVLAVDQAQYRNVNAGTAEWSRSLESGGGYTVYVQAADLNYKGDNRVRDARLTVVGLSGWKPLPGSWQPFVSLGINGGREHNERNRDDLARDLFGGRIGLGLTLSERVNAAVSATWQRSHYNAEDALFATRRSDRYTALEAALGYAFTPSLSGRLEVSGNQNRSNVALFEYSRNTVALKLRYDFK
ncbi:MAG: hypothetical protein ABI583_02625 [Betaproteobacteria bacterium]